MPATFDLRGASLSKQTVLEASYSGIRAPTQHPGNIGDEAEADWVEIPRDFLPNRYQVGPIFAVDHTGARSDQIDPAIYDRQYSPQRFGTHEGVRFVPAENVYAAFEVKPDLTAEHLTYAQNKITSVATSSGLPPRSSTPGGKFGAINPDFKPIIGGILTTRTGLGRTRCHHRPAQPGLRGVIVGGYGCSYEPLNCKNAKPGSRWVPGLAHAWHNRAKEGAPSRLLLCTMATELLGIAPSALARRRRTGRRRGPSRRGRTVGEHALPPTRPRRRGIATRLRRAGQARVHRRGASAMSRACGARKL